MKNPNALVSGASLIAMLAASGAQAQPLAEIEAAAKAEGMLTTIALPHDWCNYGEIIASFKAKYPEITVNELNPDAGSADELEAIRANKDNTRPQAPDVIDVVLAGVYVQAISAYAPHPNAAKLWMEHLFSNEGRNGYVKGYCHTARFNSMVAAGQVPQELLDALPPADAYARAVFPSVAQQEANKAVVTGHWDAVVGAQVAE